MKKLIKKIKGSDLVEKLMIVALSVAAGAVVVAFIWTKIQGAKETSVGTL